MGAPIVAPSELTRYRHGGTAVEGAGPGRYTHAVVSAPRRPVWPVVLAVQLGVLLAALDATIVGTAMPTIITTLGGVRLYPWVFSVYMLASTVVMPVFGGVSDRLGRKGPYVAAVGIFCAGSLVGGAAVSMPVLIAGRALQGIGAGGILALSLIIFGDLFAGPRRGRMQAFITAVWGLASIVGPMAGGVIVDQWSWRWVFYLNLPLGAVVVALVLVSLAETAPGASGRRLDLLGAATFLAGVTALMVAVLQPVEETPSPLLVTGRGAAALVALVCLGAFAWIEARSADPLLPLGLFREASFAAGSAAGFFSGAAMFGALVHVPLLVQWGQGTDATTAGLALMTMSGGWSAGGLVAGQIINRIGFWGLTVGGMALMTAGYVTLALRPDMTWGMLMGTGGAIGVGMGLTSITLIVAVQTLIRLERRGVATSGVLFFRNIGATLGVAVMGATLTARLGAQASGLGGGVRTLPPALAASLVAGMGAVFWLGAAAAALGLVATWFLPRGSLRSVAAAVEPVEPTEGVAG